MRTHTFTPLVALVHVNPKTPLSGVLEFVCGDDTVSFVMSRSEIEVLQETISDALSKAPTCTRPWSSSSSATPRNK
jgi:hypothetical protein